jgi:hypothetical protein
VSNQRLRREQYRRMQPGDIQCDPADSPMLRQCEEATVRNAMGAQRIEVENDCGYQRRVSYSRADIPVKARRCGERQHEKRGEQNARDDDSAKVWRE